MSRIFVDRISPYQSGSLVIDGYDPTIDTGSFATTGSNTFTGKQTVNSYVEQNFTAPANNQEIAFATVTGASVNGKNYNRVFYGIADYPGAGVSFEDYFAIEYYDSFGYNFGTELNLNGSGAKFLLVPSGSGFSQAGILEVKDEYDGTSFTQVQGTKVNVGSVSQTTEINIGGVNTNNINITGSANFADTLKLAPQDPLPTGGVGEIAVSGSNLYYHNGSSWSQLN
jgi:hypothetical protein